MYTHSKQYVTAGKAPADAKGALILIHGRGGTAQNILSLADDLDVKDFAIYAPQASNHSWYPYSFMAPDTKNQPALNSAIEIIDQLVTQVIADGTSTENIYFAGFSQGACLTLEYIARNAKRYSGAVAFTGGLIGQNLDVSKYTGDFGGTPISITTGDPDPHVPLSRVEESVAVLNNLKAEVFLKVYPGRPHTIIDQEIERANKYVFNKEGY